MSDVNHKQHPEEEQKEVSSTQATTNDQAADPKPEQPAPLEKVITPLPDSDVKPSAPFKLFSFIGDNSEVKIANWIRVYESMANRSGWSDDEKTWNLPSYLEQEAFDYYVDQVLIKNPDWKQAKQSMLTRFDQYDVEAFMEFLSFKWSPRVELKEYFKKMRAMGMASNLREEEILAGLNRNLPTHLRTELQFVTSLQQWVAVAFCLQQKVDQNNSSNYSKGTWKGRRGGRGNSRSGNPNKPRTNQGDLLASNLAHANGDSHNDG